MKAKNSIFKNPTDIKPFIMKQHFLLLYQLILLQILDQL